MAAGIDGKLPGSGGRRVADYASHPVDVLSALSRRRRFAQFMKFVLPLLAVVTVAAVVVWPQLTKQVDFLPLSFTDVDSTNAALVMRNPRYHATDANNQPYVVTADRAIQDPQDDQLVTMDNVHADLTMTDGAWWSLTADTGLYNGKVQLLNLFGNIQIFSDNGYELHGLSAEVDLTTKRVASDQKVWGQSALGLIRGNGLRISENGRVIHVINGVNTTVYPQGKRS